MRPRTSLPPSSSSLRTTFPQRLLGFLRCGPAWLCGIPLLGACSFFVAAPEPAQPVVQEPVFTGPQTFEEEFPFVRFLDNEDGSLTAVLTVPLGVGDDILARLQKYCPCLQSPEEGLPASASIEVIKEGGMVYDNNLDEEERYPWKTGGKFKAVEDLLVISGSEDDLREIFDAVDYWFNSGPQIQIEAVVLENLTNDSFDRGLAQVGSLPLFQDAQSSSFLRSIGVSFPAPTDLGGAFQVGLIDSSFQLDAVLQFLQKKGLVDVVSQPKIVVRNGVTATVQSIEEIPFLELSSITLSGATSFKIGRRSIGVTMHVTPFLVGVDTIHLVIDVEVSRLGRDFVIGTDGEDQPIFAPSVNTRKASTEVYVRNGTHVIIGGLLLETSRVSESKVPFLGDLPILGWLFSSRSTEKVTTQVTFMFKPTIKDRPSIDRFGDVFDPFEEVDNSD